MSSLPLRISLYSVGGTIFAATAYVVGLTYAPAPTNVVSDEHRRRVFEQIAPSYETRTSAQEFYLGIGRIRRRVLKDVEGSVLEVGAGTGTNVGLYGERAQLVTLCDRSQPMVDATATKIQTKRGYAPERLVALNIPASATAAAAAPKVAIRSTNASPTTGVMAPPPRTAADASSLVAVTPAPNPSAVADSPTPHYRVCTCASEALPFADSSFDTVVDMFGLCSFDDPVVALKEMSRVCKPEGRVILVEHGRGTSQTVNGYLDKWAPRHADRWGCWWNRDINRYVRLADMRVVSTEEKHFGTTHVIVAKPTKPKKK